MPEVTDVKHGRCISSRPEHSTKNKIQPKPTPYTGGTITVLDSATKQGRAPPMAQISNPPPVEAPPIDEPSCANFGCLSSSPLHQGTATIAGLDPTRARIYSKTTWAPKAHATAINKNQTTHFFRGRRIKTSQFHDGLAQMTPEISKTSNKQITAAELVRAAASRGDKGILGVSPHRSPSFVVYTETTTTVRTIPYTQQEAGKLVQGVLLI